MVQIIFSNIQEAPGPNFRKVGKSRGPQIRVRNWKLVFLFLNENIYCGYSKEPSQ